MYEFLDLLPSLILSVGIIAIFFMFYFIKHLILSYMEEAREFIDTSNQERETVPMSKQFYAMKWKLVFIICLLMLTGGIGGGFAYHYFVKPKEVVVKEVEVVKEIQVVKEGFKCAFIDCYEYRGMSIYYAKKSGCCNDTDLVFAYKDHREFAILRNAVSRIRKVYGKHYYGYEFKAGKLIIHLESYDNYKGFESHKVDSRLLYKNKEKINDVFTCIDISESELMRYFSDDSYNKDDI